MAKHNKPMTIKARKPRRMTSKRLTIDFRELFGSLTELGATAAPAFWGEPISAIGTLMAGVKAVSSLGTSDPPEERAWKLIQRSVIRAIAEATAEIIEVHGRYEGDLKKLRASVDEHLISTELDIDSNLWRSPRSVKFLPSITEAYKRWLIAYGLREIDALRAAETFRVYLIDNLFNEWKENSDYYDELYKEFSTPFSLAVQREREWEKYNAHLERQTFAPIFGRNFGIHHIYVPLAAYFEIEQAAGDDKRRRVINTYKVVDPEEHCKEWLQFANEQEAVLVISGGPGSGKSSFAKIFAAKIAQTRQTRVLFFPLQRFSLSDRLPEAIGHYLKYTGHFSFNPTDHLSHDDKIRVLLVFDGLDELTKPGEAAEIEAKRFFTELRTSLAQLNSQECKFLAIVTGRTAIIQASREALRAKPGAELHLLKLHNNDHEIEADEFDEVQDKKKLAERDLRKDWWKKYSGLNAEEPEQIPDAFYNEDIEDLTAEPLLIFLFTLSQFHKKSSNTSQINRNSIYAALFEGVQARKYESSPDAITDLLSKDEFEGVMEAIATAAWYGDGRTATIEEVRRTCSGLIREAFERAITSGGGIHKLIAAFYFQESKNNNRQSKAFEFTHKSFGEYLTARRIVRQIKDSNFGLKLHHSIFTVPEALTKWADLTAREPITTEVLRFLFDELRLQPITEIREWQESLLKMLVHSLKHGPGGLPTDTQNIHRLSSYASHTEETLLASLSCCARVTEEHVNIPWDSDESAANMIQRIRANQGSNFLCVVSESLCLLNFSEQTFYMMDLFDANFSGSVLTKSNFFLADLREANFSHVQAELCNFRGATIDATNFAYANLSKANFSSCRTLRVTGGLSTTFREASAEGAQFRYSSLIGADFSGANLRGADFTGAELHSASFAGALLDGAIFDGAIINLRSFDSEALKLKEIFKTAIKSEELIPTRLNDDAVLEIDDEEDS